MEGIIVSKHFFDDRHVIAKIIDRNGELHDIVFYGGRGGGKKQRSSILELGFLLNIELEERSRDLKKAKSFNLAWAHERIRHRYTHFSSMCLILELFSTCSSGDPLLFNLLANALFALDKEVGGADDVLVVALTKLIGLLGIFPNLSHCIHCGLSLEKAVAEWQFDRGGFSCLKCCPQQTLVDQWWWEKAAHFGQQSFKQIQSFNESSQAVTRLVHYFSYAQGVSLPRSLMGCILKA